VEPKRILCVCTSGVGNAIMFTPVIANIRLRYPYSRLFFAGSPTSAQVVAGSEFVDEVVEYDIAKRWQSLFLVRRVRPDLVAVSFSDRGIFISFLSWASGAKIRAGFVYRNRGIFYNRPLFIDSFFEKHEVQHNLDLCRILGVPIVSGKTFFAVSEQDEEFADDWLKKQGLSGRAIVGFHPGSNPKYVQKRWPAKKFGELASIFAKQGFSVLTFGGTGEEKLFFQIKEIEPSAESAIGIGLKRSAAILKKCAGFVANDSGFMHMAYTLGVPVLGLIGPTPENRYGPLGISSIVTAPMSCRPCYRGQKRIDCEHVNCMQEISVDSVTREFFRLLDRARALRESNGRAEFDQG